MTKVESNEFLKLIPEFLELFFITCTHTMLLFWYYLPLSTACCTFGDMSWGMLISVPSSLSHPYQDSRCVHLFTHSEHAWQFRVYQGSRFYMLSPLFEDYALDVSPDTQMMWGSWLHMSKLGLQGHSFVFMVNVVKIIPYQHFICSQSLLSLPGSL